MTITADHIRQAAPLDSTTWTCAGCSGIFIGQLPADTTCRDCRAPGASWKTPRVLAKALGKWAARDDTRPDTEARAAAGDALAAIDATIAELAALRARLVREIDSDAPVTCEIADDDEDLAAADVVEDQAPGRPPVTAPLMTVVSAAGLVGDLDEDDERPAAYMACGDQLATGEPQDQGPADCPRHGPTRFITLDAWMDAATALPPGGLYELVFRFAESDRWTDEELAALPPMFPPVPPRVGPWPYARAA